MKKEFLLLLAASTLGGCMVYRPGPGGEFGYTYDYSAPVVETAPPRVIYGSTGSSYGPVVLDEKIPDAPRVPPAYSEIPEPYPRPAVVRQTVVTPVPIVQESAGAATTQTVAPTQAVPQAAAQAPAAVYPPVTVFADSFPGLNVTNTDTNPTVTTTNQFSQSQTNQNDIAITNQVTVTNQLTTTNQFATTNAGSLTPLPGATNGTINEAAGASRTNGFNPPQQQTIGVGTTQPQPAQQPGLPQQQQIGAGTTQPQSQQQPQSQTPQQRAPQPTQPAPQPRTPTGSVAPTKP